MTSVTSEPIAAKTADEINELVAANIKLVTWTLWNKVGVPRQVLYKHEHDLHSAGAWGLKLAVETYDESRGLTFGSWACCRIRWSILRALRAAEPKVRSVHVVLESDLGGGLTLAGIPNPEPGIRPKAPAILDGLLSALPDRERMVIEGRWGIAGPEMTLAELGGVMGISRERVRQIEAKAFGKLQHAARQRRHAS